MVTKRKPGAKRKPTGTASKTAPARVANRLVDGTEAARLRAAGASFREIAATLNCSLSRAHKLVTDQLDLVAFDNVVQMRTQEGERLDRLQRTFWRDALAGDIKAAHTVIRISERRAKLFGLDAAIQVEADVTVHETVSRDMLTERLTMMRERMQQQAIDATSTVVDDDEPAKEQTA
jgi:hypothetical protein